MSSKRFTSLEAVRAERLRLATDRDRHAERLQEHMEALANKDFRRNIMRTVVGDTVSGLLPDGLVGALIGKGGFARGLDLAMGTSGGWAKRAGLFALGLAFPSLLDRVQRIPFAEIGREVGVSLERIKAYFLKDQRGEEHRS